MTREELRQRILRNLGCLVVNGTVDANCSTTVISSTNFLSKREDEMLGSYICMTDGDEADQERTITAFDARTGKATLNKALSGTPATGEKVEVTVRLEKSTVDDTITMCINGIRNFFLSVISDRTTIISGRLVQSSDTAVTTTSTTYTSVASVTAQKAGSLSIGFDLKSSARQYISYGKIYVNAVATGTERTSIATSYETQPTEKITVAVGDTVAIYAKVTTGGTASVRNFRIVELDSDVQDYPIPSTFNYINKLMVETSEGFYDLESKWYEVAIINSENRLRTHDKWVNNYSGYHLEIIGQGYPTAPATDSASNPIPDTYTLSWCCWYLGITTNSLSVESPEGAINRLNFWRQAAQDVLNLERSVIQPGAQKVP